MKVRRGVVGIDALVVSLLAGGALVQVILREDDEEAGALVALDEASRG